MEYGYCFAGLRLGFAAETRFHAYRLIYSGLFDKYPRLKIMREVGDISRFPKVGNFASYCRCVSSNRLSDGKTKGHGNRKNGNRYLSRAFIEAAHMTFRYNERLRGYCDRKVAQMNTGLATKALSNKLARMCYHIIRDQVPYSEGLSAQ
jgi:transposase